MLKNGSAREAPPPSHCPAMACRRIDRNAAAVLDALAQHIDHAALANLGRQRARNLSRAMSLASL